jgi:hypothetical protein
MSAPAAVQAEPIKPAVTPVTHGLLQRCTATQECDDCRKKGLGMLQRAAVDSSPVNEVPPIVHEVLSSPGQPLDAQTRSFMEPRFGRDFSNVRVHTDAKAAESAQAVDALAYTVGQHIVFDLGLYNTSSANGRRLVAHELAHTIQQSHQVSKQGLGIDRNDSSLERAADRAAEAALSSACAASTNVARNQLVFSSMERPILQRTRMPTCRNGRLSRRQYVEGIAWLEEEGHITAEEAGNLREHIPDSRRERCRLFEELRRGTRRDRTAPVPAPAPPAACTPPFQRATTFQQLIDLVRAAETRLTAGGITSTTDQIHALRGIYYGTRWSQDYAVEHSDTRNEGFQRFTRPSLDPSRSIPRDVRSMLDCGLFEALQNSQDIVDGSRQIDFGHLLIGLDARSDPAFATNIQYPVMLMNIDLGGTGTELVTWLGDLGGGAAALASRRVASASTSAGTVFTGSDYGGSINLEGDIAGFVVATGGSPAALTAPTFTVGSGRLSDALQGYLSPGAPGASWTNRAATFLRMYGATFDVSTNTLTNRPALIALFSGKIQIFACNYLASRVRDRRIPASTARAAADHVIPASEEVASAFVDALDDSRRTGNRIEARRFPSPRPASPGACAQQLRAASVLGTLGM